MPEGFSYSSGNNDRVLSILEIRNIIKEFTDGEKTDILRAANN